MFVYLPVFISIRKSLNIKGKSAAISIHSWLARLAPISVYFVCIRVRNIRPLELLYSKAKSRRRRRGLVKMWLLKNCYYDGSKFSLFTDIIPWQVQLKMFWRFLVYYIAAYNTSDNLHPPAPLLWYDVGIMSPSNIERIWHRIKGTHPHSI